MLTVRSNEISKNANYKASITGFYGDCRAWRRISVAKAPSGFRLQVTPANKRRGHRRAVPSGAGRAGSA